MDVNRFVLNHDVRLTWIAFFTQWALWGTIYFLRHLTDDKPSSTTVSAAAAVAEMETDENREPKSRIKRWKLAKVQGSRLTRVHHVLSENTLLLLSVLVLNTFGGGSARAVMVLTWIFFALTAVAAFTEIGSGHRFGRFLYSFAIFGVAFAIGVLGLKQGWRE
ncbi:hypothetical protein BX666DRAFT_1664197 [Dichotomocladium elegans]|nr:hypothetical protein BX666DRAFT_1664197 [Dichotomocladium elegans]